jgi:uncharacterized protein YggT (Ycf19 family)
VALAIGGTLIVGGMLWCFLVQFQRRRPAAAQALDGSFLLKLARLLFKVARKFFPNKEMWPGAFMMVLGVLVVVATLIASA